MSVRIPQPRMLPGEDVLAAAGRILKHPSANVQRVAMDEIYSFAVTVLQFDALGELAGRHMAGLATPNEIAALTTLLDTAGFLPGPAPAPQKG